MNCDPNKSLKGGTNKIELSFDPVLVGLHMCEEDMHYCVPTAMKLA